MKTVRLLQSVAGIDFSWMPGDEVEMTDEQAGAWADGVRGELVKKAVKPAPQVPERPAPETPEGNVEQPVRRGRPKKTA
jgi:hypothetical protein